MLVPTAKDYQSKTEKYLMKRYVFHGSIKNWWANES